VANPDPARLGDAAMRVAVLSVFASGVALSIGALALFGGRAALGVAIGGAIATANLALFARLGDVFIARKGRTAPWTAIALLKLVFLFGGVWLILESEIVSALALAAGYGALPVGIILGSLFGPKPPEDDDEGPPGADENLPRKGESSDNHVNKKDNSPNQETA
jgi:hypothetical protein